MSERIKAIASFINPYKRIADVGCDHGYLIIEAFKQGINFAQAIDNKKGPLNQAIINLQSYTNKVSFSLSNGLEKLDEKVEVIVIAGMGGISIIDIFKAHPEKLVNIQRLILQANRNQKELRKYISQIGFKIVSEKIIYEDEVYYEIIVCDKGNVSYSDDELTYGPLLLQERSPLFIEKWTQVINKYELINTKATIKKADVIRKVLGIEVNHEN
jgi:tRNA (adenine22-N1)-methyltransferase